MRLADTGRLDTDLLLQKLLRRDIAQTVTVLGELDFDTIENTPAVTHSSTTPGQGSNGLGLRRVTVTLNLYALTVATAVEVADQVTRAVHAWDAPDSAGIDGVGTVEKVTDIDELSHVDSPTLIGKDVVQYSGSFELLIRST